MTKQDENRVLNRRGARIITAEEAGHVTGAGGPGSLPYTNTACTFAIKVIAAGGNGFDGDLGECGFPN